MSENKPAAEAGRGCRTTGCLLSGVGLVIFFFLMVSGIGIGLVELGGNLLFGWIGFISRVIPRITWDWAAITTGIVFACLLGISAHFFLVWLTRGIALARAASFQWQCKWTLSGLLLLVFCLLVGMSVAGAAHQLGWILASRESLFEDRYAIRGRLAAMQVEWAAKQALSEANTLPELRKTLTVLLQRSERPTRPLPLESVQLLVSLTPRNTVDGVLIMSREKQFQTTYGAKYITTNDFTSIAAKDLSRFIQSNATNLVAF